MIARMNAVSQRLWLLPISIILLVGCASGSPPVIAPPTRGIGSLPTIAATGWNPPSREITAGTGAQIQLVGVWADHQTTVNQVSFSRDGKLVATIDALGGGRVWSLLQGTLLFRLPTDAGNRTAVFTPASDQLVVVSETGQLTFLDATNGQLLSTQRGSGEAFRLASVSPDGTLLALGGDQGEIQVIDLDKRSLRRTLKGGSFGIRRLTLAPNNTTVISVTDDLTMTIWDIATGEVRSKLTGFTTIPRYVLFAPDGRSLIVNAGAAVFAYETENYALRYRFTVKELNLDAGFAISPDSQLLVIATTNVAAPVLRLETGERVTAIPEQQQGGSSYAFAPNGSFLLNTLIDPGAGAFIWQRESLAVNVTQLLGKQFNQTGNGIVAGYWSPDSRVILLTDRSGGIFIWGLPNQP